MLAPLAEMDPHHQKEIMDQIQYLVQSRLLVVEAEHVEVLVNLRVLEDPVVVELVKVLQLQEQQMEDQEILLL